MNHLSQKTISLLIKASIGIILAVLFVVLLAQYITMAQLGAKQESLDRELETATAQYQELEAEYNNINDNYDEYVEFVTRNNDDYGFDDDVLINKN